MLSSCLKDGASETKGRCVPVVAGVKISLFPLLRAISLSRIRFSYFASGCAGATRGTPRGKGATWVAFLVPQRRLPHLVH